MPSHCCVPKCRSNYPGSPSVSTFSFPKDEDLKQKWLSAIPRENFTITPHTKVCKKHFKPEDLVTEASAYDTLAKLTFKVPLRNLRLKSDAVPSIFEILPVVKQCKIVKKSSLKHNQGKDDIESSVGTSAQRKGAKSPISPIYEVESPTKCSKPHDEKKKNAKSLKQFSVTDQPNRAVSPKKSPSKCEQSPTKISSTTDRPIIAVIKAQDLVTSEDKSSEKMDEDSDDAEILEEEVSSFKSFSLPSPYKHLPDVSVRLREEDRVPFTRVPKGVKRSPSTGSNSSSGSADTQKSATNILKRRKVEKPAPVVIGRQNDCYCWVCHRENITLVCIACPRAYHAKCAGESTLPTSDWVCSECQHVLAAENVDTRSSTLSQISLEKLGALLKLSLNKMKQRAPIAFHQPVSLEHYPLYPHYVIHPMDFSLLERNIKQKVYGCTEAFLADVKWISHNSCVFNGTQHPLSTNAKNLIKACDQDMQEIEVCPDCFVHSVVRNKYWFSEVCRKPHPLVWAKLKGFPYWPAKVVRIVDGNVDARFFGAHDRAWVPLSQCYHLSKEMPTTSKPKKKGNYEVALDELNVHVHLLIQKFGIFEYAPYRTNFTTHDKYLLYHGIDIDKTSKEDISIDNSISQSEMKLYNSEKENRFASFMESESEKSNADEMRLDENPSEARANALLKLNEGFKSPIFTFKERKSTDSMLSDKDAAEDEAIELETLTEEKKNETIKCPPEKEPIPDKMSDSDQLRKLELALERIKGYVSLNVDTDKETNETQNEEKEEKDAENEGKNDTKEVEKGNTEKLKLSPLMRKTVTLPVIETSTVQENVEDVSVTLEAMKKTDSFFSKLNETIESCKAKLGISEINDDISSDESGGDENASKSEDEEEDSSASEAEASEDDANMETSDEEVENGDMISKRKTNSLSGNSGEESADSDSDDESSESGEESNAESSGTDIESSNETPAKKIRKFNSQTDSEGVIEESSCESEVHTASENNAKELVDVRNDTAMTNFDGNGTVVTNPDSNEAIITNPNVQVPEITIDDSGALEVVEKNDSTENNNELRENYDSSLTQLPNSMKSSETVIPLKKLSTDISPRSNPKTCSLEVAKDKNSNVRDTEPNIRTISSIDFITSEEHNLPNNIEKLLSPVQPLTSSRVGLGRGHENARFGNSVVQNYRKEATGSALHVSDKKEPEEEEVDDDIFIFTPAKPKSPPVIVLDDDQDNEESSASDTFAVKSPPYSTSVESFSNEEIPAARTNPGDEHDIAGKEVPSERSLSEKEMRLIDSAFMADNEEKSSSPPKSRKRSLSSDDESSASDDDIQVVTPLKRPKPLTGAIRTFNKPCNSSTPSLKPTTPTMETVKRNLERENLNQLNELLVPVESTEVEISSASQERISIQQSVENLLKNPPIDTSNMSDKDKEILFLRRKMNCIMTAYKIQSWKCNQEREELRHNMNLIIMEMRASLEVDKKQAIEKLVRKHELEKQKSIEETKRKQWCACCHTESRYACCWNTSYCSVDCQKQHFKEHRGSCTQVKNKKIVEVRRKPGGTFTTENNEKKKVIIVNMKHVDNTQQTPVNKPQITSVKPAKNSVQIASTSSSSNIQFVLTTPVRSQAEPAVTPSVTTSSKEQNLDSAQIIHQVRNKVCDLGTAISLLKKKNLESSLSLMNKEEKEQKEKPKDSDLEEIYFPSPPKVTFEGYESASPEPNLVILEDEISGNSDVESEPSKEVNPEPDLVLSDTDDLDNEMVNIGHAVDVKAKFLNKCLVFGQTAKQLTRCLVDVIFPDMKLLATCSALGNKSNVTKLTRAALPTRKVHAIIDFVRKRYPNASRSEIVLTINMKCKEARMMLSRKEAKNQEKPKKLLDSETQAESSATPTTSIPTTTTSPISHSTKTGAVCSTTTTTCSTVPAILSPVLSTTSSILSSTQIIASKTKTSPNVVCVKSSNQPPTPLQFHKPNKPGFLQRSSQILIRPKQVLPMVSVGNAAIIQTVSQSKKQDTVKNLLAANRVNLPMGSLSNDGTKLLMAIDTLKSSTASTQPAAASSTSTGSIRPYIIINPQASTARPSSSIQHPALPISSHIKK